MTTMIFLQLSSLSIHGFLALGLVRKGRELWLVLLQARELTALLLDCFLLQLLMAMT
jgi:hypothetical protein